MDTKKHFEFFKQAVQLEWFLINMLIPNKEDDFMNKCAKFETNYDNIINNNKNEYIKLRYDKLEILLKDILTLKSLINTNKEIDIQLKFHLKILENLLTCQIKNTWDIVILCEDEVKKYNDKFLNNYFNYCLLNYRQDKLNELHKVCDIIKVRELPNILKELDKHVEHMRVCFLLDIKKPVREFSEVVTLKRYALYFIKKNLCALENHITEEECILFNKNDINMVKISRDIYFKFNQNLRKELKDIAKEVLEKESELFENIIITDKEILDLIKSIMVFICKFTIIIKKETDINAAFEYCFKKSSRTPLSVVQELRKDYKDSFMKSGRKLMFNANIGITLTNMLLEKLESMIKILMNNIDKIFERINEETNDIEVILEEIIYLINKNKKRKNRKNKKDKEKNNLSIEEKEIFEQKFQNLMNELKIEDENNDNDNDIKCIMLELEEKRKAIRMQGTDLKK
jgi:hypothetical protein